MTPLNPPYLMIRDGLLKGRVIPLLGSGASIDERRTDAKPMPGQGSYLPSAYELARHLAEKSGFPGEKAAAYNLFSEGVSKVDSDPKAARENLQQALEKYREMKKRGEDVERDELNTLTSLGKANQNDHQYYAAEKNFKEVRDRRKDNISRSNLGNLYFVWAEFMTSRGKKAKWQSEQACKILTQVADPNATRACDKLKEITEPQPEQQ